MNANLCRMRKFLVKLVADGGRVLRGSWSGHRQVVVLICGGLAAHPLTHINLFAPGAWIIADLDISLRIFGCEGDVLHFSNVTSVSGVPSSMTGRL